jgi:hypothetical protein
VARRSVMPSACRPRTGCPLLRAISTVGGPGTTVRQRSRSSVVIRSDRDPVSNSVGQATRTRDETAAGGTYKLSRHPPCSNESGSPFRPLPTVTLSEGCCSLLAVASANRNLDLGQKDWAMLCLVCERTLDDNGLDAAPPVPLDGLIVNIPGTTDPAPTTLRVTIGLSPTSVMAASRPKRADEQ